MIRRGMAAYHQTDFETAHRFLESGGNALPRLQPYAKYFIIRNLLSAEDYAGAAKAARSFQRTVDVISLVRPSGIVESRVRKENCARLSLADMRSQAEPGNEKKITK